MSLLPDEKQEFGNSARRTAELAELHWRALDELTTIPLKTREEMILIWWRVIITPPLQMPDFSKLLQRPDEEE